MMFRIKHKGDFAHLEKLLKFSFADYLYVFDKYGKLGVEALAKVTPYETGKTSESWGYEILRRDKSITLAWTNSNTSNGVPVVILLQFGHGTRTGGYVQGYDFINPTIRPIFDSFVDDIWKEVTKR